MFTLTKLHLLSTQPGASVYLLCAAHTGGVSSLRWRALWSPSYSRWRLHLQWLTFAHTLVNNQYTVLLGQRKTFANFNGSCSLVFIMAVPMSIMHIHLGLHSLTASCTPLTKSVISPVTILGNWKLSPGETLGVHLSYPRCEEVLPIEATLPPW